MTKQKEIQEGLARRMFDSQMNADQCFGVATREKVWLEEKDGYMARAYNDLHWLSSQGTVMKLDGELPVVNNEFWKMGTDERAAWSKGRKDTGKAGYVAIEPLIGM